MKKVYSAEISALVGFIKDIFDQNSIPCIIKNQYLSGAAGELSPIDIWPEIWVTNDEDYNRALKLVEVTLKEGLERNPWRCDGCGEDIESQFAACWNCGAGRPE